MIEIKTVMLPLHSFPVVKGDVILKIVLEQMNAKRLGIACVVDNKSNLLGIITDGDIRRKLLSYQKPISAFFVDDCINHMIDHPSKVELNESLNIGLDLMKLKGIWDLPVTQKGVLVGLLHLHPVVEALIKKENKIN